MRKFLKENGVWIGFLGIALLFTLLTKGDFLVHRNLSNLLRQTAINGILACGMTYVIITGGIDLSVGSIVALTGMVAGILQLQYGLSNWGIGGALICLLSGLGVGLICGVLTGGLIARLKIAPFVITLGFMVIARGLVMIISGGTSLSPMGDVFNELAGGYLSVPSSLVLFVVLFGTLIWKYRKNIWQSIIPILVFSYFGYSLLQYKGFPNLAIFLFVAAWITHFILANTTFGRSIYAIGSNEKAAFWAGVQVKRTLWLVYIWMGGLSALAGTLLTARLNGADPNAGQMFELDAIAAVVIGGTSLKGGTGSIFGSLVGALTIATLNNGMDMMGIPSFYQMIFKGIIIIGAVALDKGQRST